MRQQYSPNISEETMLPYKGHGFIQNYQERVVDRSAQQENVERPYMDQSAFNELSRKVDWLVEEVRSMKQTLLSYERRTWGRSSYEQYDSREDVDRRVVASRDNIDPRYYEQVGSYANKPMRRHTYVEYENEGHAPRTKTFPYELLSRSDHESPYSSDSPVSTGSKPERIRTSSELSMVTTPTNPSYSTLPDDINIAEIVLLWQRGMNDIPPVVSWSQKEKLQHRNEIEQWFCIYHLFSVHCNADIGRFISQYTDTNGKMMSPTQVASLCPDVSSSVNMFLHSKGADSDRVSVKSNEKIFILPRKINGRKVSAKDVIQLWEHGMGDIPPIKSWTKTQKFKQQSKISRWKKIVDIFKYQCNSDMRKFEEIYTDVHGCLLPVAAITSKFETIYGDELNITSKLMTVSTAQENEPSIEAITLKRSSDSDEIGGTFPKRARDGNIDTLPDPPSLIRKTPSPPTLIKTASPPGRIKPKVEVDDYPDVQSQEIRKDDNTYVFEDQSSPSNSESENEDSKRPDSNVYLVPESASIQDLIIFWERGCSDFPPIKSWSIQQRCNQKQLIVRIEKLIFLYKNVFKSEMESFTRACVNKDDTRMSLDEIIFKFQHIIKDRFPSEKMTTPSASSMTFDFSHHKTISQSTDALYLLPRKINGRKVNAKDVLQLWYHGLNKIPAVKQWGPQQKAIQQSKISRWKKIVDLFEQEFTGDWERFEKHFSNNVGQLLPITAIIAKHEEECKTMGGSATNLFH